MRFFLIVVLLYIVGGCATYRTKVAVSYQVDPQTKVEVTVFEE